MLGRPSGVGNGNPLQYSHLENSRDRGAWRAYIHQFPWGFRMALNVYINLKINDIFIVLRPFICECLSPPSFTHFLVYFLNIYFLAPILYKCSPFFIFFPIKTLDCIYFWFKVLKWMCFRVFIVSGISSHYFFKYLSASCDDWNFML